MVFLDGINLYSERATQAQFAGSTPSPIAIAAEALGDAACDILSWSLPKTPTTL
jgi:hypothetical protein